jgi:LysM repeat protein
MFALAIIASLGLALSIRESRADVVPNNTQFYRVKQGDTLQMVAAEFYGDRNKVIFIMVENKIPHPRPLKPGERLRVPIERPITTSPEDTWQTLAGTYLGDPRRGSFLAEFNDMNADEAVPAGTLLHVPFVVTHTAEATETFASISAAYFGESKHADMLRRYNFREKMSIEKGDTISVPVFHIRLQASKLPPTDADAKTRQAMRRTAGEDAAKALPRAWQAWRSGESSEIESLLSKLKIDFLDTDPAVQVQMLRGLAHIAEGKVDIAIEDFKKLRERKKEHVLRKFDYSSKILAIWEQAGGKVE